MIHKIELNTNYIIFARTLIKSLGFDETPIEDHWCYKELVEYYGNNKNLINKVKQYFETYPDDCIIYHLYEHNAISKQWFKNNISSPYYAFLSVTNLGVETQWAKKIIEKESNAKNAFNLLHFHMDKNKSNIEWAKKIIEAANDPQHAYYMAKNNYCNKEWAKRIIESTNSSYYAYCIAIKHDEDKKWAEKIIENDKSALWAFWMVRNCVSNKKWAEKIIENNNYWAAEFAYKMAKYCDSNKEWAEKIIKNNNDSYYLKELNEITT